MSTLKKKIFYYQIQELEKIFNYIKKIKRKKLHNKKLFMKKDNVLTENLETVNE